MRMLMHFQFPVEPFNTAVRDGSAGQKIQKILEAVKQRIFFRAKLPTWRRFGSECYRSFRLEGLLARFAPEDLMRVSFERSGKQWA
jgi:hypothetical protein